MRVHDLNRRRSLQQLAAVAAGVMLPAFAQQTEPPEPPDSTIRRVKVNGIDMHVQVQV